MTMEYYYNNAIGKKFLEGVSKGLPCATAAKYARVPPTTMRTWLDDGERGKDPVLRKLYEDYSEAVAQRTIEQLELLDDQAYIWKALQAFNDDFNTASKVDVKQKDTAEVDLFNKDTMIANIEEVIHERKKRNNE